MNKHQEALDRLENFAYNGGEKGDNVKIIQELVDKATPKEPIIQTFKQAFGSGYHDVYFCPKCMSRIDAISKSCCSNNECRQAIDWSNNED